MENTMILKASVGSVNYNLQTKNSDRDYKIFVYPNFADLYKGNRVSISKEVDGEDLNIIDIRNFSNLMVKSNINFLEVLFAEELEIFDVGIQSFIDLREDIARINLPYLYNACMGTAGNKYHKSKSSTPKTKESHDKFGYDVKGFYHSVRLFDFIKRYAQTDFKDFKRAIRYEDDDAMRSTIMKIREGRYPISEAEEMFNKMEETALSFKDIYLQQSKNMELINHIDTEVMSMVEKEILRK